MPQLNGQTFAGYEIIETLGEGAMATVYKAREALFGWPGSNKRSSPPRPLLALPPRLPSRPLRARAAYHLSL